MQALGQQPAARAWRCAPRHHRRPAICVQLRGSKSVEAANDKFRASMTNVVRWREAAAPAPQEQQQQQQQQCGGEGGGAAAAGAAGAAAALEICSETSLQVELEVPGWFILPVAAIEKTGG